MQRLDPPGVGARDLRECLLLQLTPGMPYYEELQTLIEHHLEDLEHNRLPLISKKTGYLDRTDPRKLWDELRKLNPKPGADFSDAIVPSVTPDVFVERGEDGGYEVRLEDGQHADAVHQPVLPQAAAQAAETNDARPASTSSGRSTRPSG